MTDNSLLNLAFEPLNNSEYRLKIKRYFIGKLGQNNDMKIDRWVSEFTNKNALFESIARDIKANHTMVISHLLMSFIIHTTLKSHSNENVIYLFSILNNMSIWMQK